MTLAKASAVMAAILVALMVVVLAAQKMVTVPDVRALTVKQAEATLADAGLKCEVREVDTGGQFPKGQIVGQNPGPVAA
jgi:beta-lactam-binding protein with PASTA domain